jgi:NaMN:DMB phosphoribosyltransferase
VNADSRHLLDGGTWFAAAVAVVSLSQLAFALTIIATTISIVLGLIRVHDRLKYGPAQGQLDALTDFVFNLGSERPAKLDPAP